MLKRLFSMLLVLFIMVNLLFGCESFNVKNDSSEFDENINNSVGKVYYLNYKTEQAETWKKLATKYTALTGVKVEIVTPSNDKYEETLYNEMEKENQPTLFEIKDVMQFNKWSYKCYDLSNTDMYDELLQSSYALFNAGKALAIPYDIESYGIIVNKKLLKRAGYSVDDIKSFYDLKRVSEDIQSRKNDLGFVAFTSSGLDTSSSWRFDTHLANLPIYFEYIYDDVEYSEKINGEFLNNYKNIFDLYINNSTVNKELIAKKTLEDSRNEFLNEQAVFYQNGSWEYKELVVDNGFTDDDLAMIPIYIGVGNELMQGLCTGSENYWCVNKNSREEDIKATIDFMYWCISSEEGIKTLSNEMGFAIPFKNAIYNNNVFIKNNFDYSYEIKESIKWVFTTIPSEKWKNDLRNALVKYSMSKNDDVWQDVVFAFVDNWEIEYKNQLISSQEFR